LLEKLATATSYVEAVATLSEIKRRDDLKQGLKEAVA
jgi:hypothetical protein